MIYSRTPPKADAAKEQERALNLPRVFGVFFHDVALALVRLRASRERFLSCHVQTYQGETYRFPVRDGAWQLEEEILSTMK
jgi:hypothetical protein